MNSSLSEAYRYASLAAESAHNSGQPLLAMRLRALADEAKAALKKAQLKEVNHG